MIIAVSDVHLGYEKSNATAFKDFLINHIRTELNKKDHFVLLGDIFDFWRKKNIDCILKNDDILNEILSLDTNVYYIIGNHDYLMLEIKNRLQDYSTFTIQKNLRLTDNKNSFFFIHGYQLDALANYERLTIWEYEKLSRDLCRTGNMLGRILSELWGIKKRRSHKSQS